MTRAAPLLSLVALFALAPGPARADVLALLADHPDAETLRGAWFEGVRLERVEALSESNARYEQVSRALPAATEPLWRLARNQWRLAERMPPAAKAERLRGFRSAEEVAARSLAIDPRCAECLFWRAAALGRVTTTVGVVEAARNARAIRDLLERAIALRPTQRDDADNTTLGNAYHAAAAFYRVMPDWLWLSWLLGVRGDKERSVAYSRRAAAISPMRLDYQVELGAGLLCLGTARARPELVDEGVEVLRHSQSLAPYVETRIDMIYAQILVEQPERACSYARDGWVDLDEEGLRATANATPGS